MEKLPVVYQLKSVILILKPLPDKPLFHIPVLMMRSFLWQKIYFENFIKKDSLFV